MPTHSIRLVCDGGPDPVTGEIRDRAEETLTVEGSTPWEARSRAVSQMTIRPTGRLLRAYDAETGQEIVHPPLEDLRPGLFVIDGLPGTYAGWTRGEEWNGFAVPYFDLAEARRVADDYAAQPSGSDGETRAEYDPDHGVIRMFDPSADEWDEVESVEIDGRTLYPVGTRVWTWEEQI